MLILAAGTYCQSYFVIHPYSLWPSSTVLWYPFDEKDKDLKARFSMVFEEA
jgi:hypothetical protein